MRWAAWATVALLTGTLGIAFATANVQVEQPWWLTTDMDLDHDGIDDALAGIVSADPLVVLVDYAQMPSPAQLEALASSGAEITRTYHNFPLVAARALPTQFPALRALPGVVMIEKNMVIDRLLKQSVPLIGAPEVWQKYGSTGTGQTIAILDDGAFEQHPGLSDRLKAHFDASAPKGITGGLLTIVAPASTEGHGTHVAGIAVGSGAGSAAPSYEGVAPGATFANVKVFNTANSTSADIVLTGLDWVIDNSVADNMRIVSMSLGGTPSDGTDAICRAVDRTVDKGLIVVAAAGNAGPGASTITAPGAAAKVITVGAVDKQKKIASYSSRGPTQHTLRMKPDLVAPGTSITSAISPSGTTATGLIGGLLGGKPSGEDTLYGALSGTSMATPHVSGVVALMLQVNPKLTPQEVKRILLVTAQDLGAAGPDNETGFGFVNAIAAVQVAKDPTLLDAPQFASVLASVPNPPPENSFASYLPWILLALIVVAALVIGGVVIAKRRKPEAPPPG